MKITNIERNIMYLLGKKWIESKTPGPFGTDWIFDKFSDIPDKNMFWNLKQEINNNTD